MITYEIVYFAYGHKALTPIIHYLRFFSLELSFFTTTTTTIQHPRGNRILFHPRTTMAAVAEYYEEAQQGEEQGDEMEVCCFVRLPYPTLFRFST